MEENNLKMTKRKFYKTGIENVDNLFYTDGGIQTGVTSIIGVNGTHKEELALYIAGNILKDQPDTIIINYDLKDKFNNQQIKYITDCDNSYLFNNIINKKIYDDNLFSLINRISEYNTKNPCLIIINISESLVQSDNKFQYLLSTKGLKSIYPKLIESNIILIFIQDKKLNNTTFYMIHNTIFKLDKVEDNEDQIKVTMIKSICSDYNTSTTISFSDGRFNSIAKDEKE